jgi:hypothetical protein
MIVAASPLALNVTSMPSSSHLLIVSSAGMLLRIAGTAISFSQALMPLYPTALF